MPYIIAALALVLVGVGFTLYKSTPINDESVVIKQENETSEMQPEVVEVAVETNSSDQVTVEEVVLEEEIEIADNEPAPAQEITSEEPVVVTTPEVAVAKEASAVTYKETSSYRTPGNNTYTLNVSMTVEDGTIAAVDIVYDEKGAADANVNRFDMTYKGFVLGKELEDLELSRVAGASLTTNAFNTALKGIQEQAEV